MHIEQVPVKILINPRESLQTPPFRGPEDGLGSAFLPAPCQLVKDLVREALVAYQNDQYVIFEFPSPMSAPSAAYLDRELIQIAHQNRMLSRIALHVRMTKDDFLLAALCGAKRIHLFGNSSTLVQKRKSVNQLLTNLDQIGPIALQHNVNDIRASLEHALHTPREEVVAFVEGIANKNHNFKNCHGRLLITALGLPDTNGDGTPEQYRELLQLVGPYIKRAGLTLFFHGHDDENLAFANAQAIIEFTSKEGIPLVVEAAAKHHPGERTGVLRFNQLSNLHLPLQNLTLLESMIDGSSWIDGTELYSFSRMREIARDTNVAGVHTDVPGAYGNGRGLPAAGIYSIMGKRNIGETQRILGLSLNDDGILRLAALVGRELSAQDGNLPHMYGLKLAHLVAAEPEFISMTGQSFDSPETWLQRPIPNLNHLREKLGLPPKQYD